MEKEEQNTALYSTNDTQILHWEKPPNKIIAPKLKLISYTISHKKKKKGKV